MYSQNKRKWICTFLILQPEDPDALTAQITFFSYFLFVVHTTTRGRLVITYRLLHNFTFPYSGSRFPLNLGAHLDHGVDV